MATQNRTLTEKAVKALKPKATVYRVRDTNPKGFGVVVAPSGTRSFFLSYTSAETGRRTQGTIGVYPGISLRDAREAAQRWRQQIREGIDPVLELRREKEDRQRAGLAEQAKKAREQALGTVEQLFETYVADLEMDGKRSAAYVQSMYARDIGPAIGGMKARDVTTDDCADILAAVSERGLILANRTRQYLVAAFNFGLKVRNLPRWRRKAPDFALMGNPATATERALKNEPRGQRHLNKDEVRQVWHALSEPYEVVGGRGAKRMASLDVPTQIAVKLLLSTGQRVEEALHATWDEFDLDDRLWVIPAARRKNAAKNVSGEPHILPLTDFHLALLEALRPFSEGTDYLFPSKPVPGEPVRPRDHRSISQAVSRLCARTGITRFAPRDIRRTWKTLAGSIGIDLEVRNRIQGHAMDDVGSRHYDRYDYLTEKRHAMARWTGFLETLLAGQDNVVAFAREA
jgi:integrase